MIFGDDVKNSDPIIGRYDELIDEIYRFANFGLFLAKQGTFPKFLKYKTV